jgi:hypothetical protein
MATEPKPSASPVCYLDEADNIYRGYAEITEIHQLIRRWIKLSPSPAVARALMALLPLELDETTAGQSGDADAGSPVSLPAETLRDEMRRLLPRIGDDAMHAKLKPIADDLSC